MKRNKTIVLIVSGLFLFIGLFGQNPVDRIWHEIDSVNVYEAVPSALPAQSRWSFNTTLGTSYMYAPHYGSGMNMFVAPHASFAASRRLSFHGGVMASHLTPVSFAENTETMQFTGMNSMAVFAAASYRLTENLTIHGAGVKRSMLTPGSLENPNYSYNDFSIGASYDFGNFTIGASIHSAQNQYIGSPIGFGNNMYGSPLYW